ncbi:MAG: hypothetical protein IPI81_08995 [Flavobacteriales bacterium]|nr:hypothetical protein [Flavobacteriales bacterium]MCC6939003.1 hypothetical protein [Flavobacteriales bacterium]
MGTLRRLSRFMEHFWLAVTIGTLVAALWVIFTDGWEIGGQWLFLPGIAGAMFFFRRITRRKLEAMEDRQRGKA